MTARLDELLFLEGRWEGEGFLRGGPARSRTSVCRTASGGLDLWVEVRQQGLVVHEERVLLERSPDGGVRCTTHPPAEAPQSWDVAGAPEWGGWLLTRPGMRWELRRTREGYEETFGNVGPGGIATPLVILSHRRDEERAK